MAGEPGMGSVFGVMRRGRRVTWRGVIGEVRGLRWLCSDVL